jgi:molybdopterin synthase catalytic subunit
VQRYVQLEAGPFDPTEQWRTFLARLDGASGGVAAYCGMVRDRFDGDTVGGLYLEHYPGMTERSLERIVDRAAERWPLQAVSVVHRVGAVEAREPIVLVMVASAHRETAFDACELIMDLLKTEAVFWKKERSARGERWVESTARDRERAADWNKDK